jgi:hypothetical protein
VRRYIRLVESTRRIEAEREQRDFEDAAARHAKFEPGGLKPRRKNRLGTLKQQT